MNSTANMSADRAVESVQDAKIRAVIGDNRCFMPTQLAIETVRACNAKCIMCPSTVMQRPKGFMRKEVHETILSKISRWGAPISLITHAGVGEPLLDKMLEERIKHEKEVFPNAQINVYTNGGLLDEERALKLIASGVDVVSFSVNGFHKETYEAVMKIPRDTTYENVERFCRLKKQMGSNVGICVSLIKTDLCSQQEIEEYKQYWNTKNVKVLTPPWISWGNFFEHSVSGHKLPCFFIWKSMVFDYDGTVKRCCEDYDSQYPMGNIMTQEPSEIFNSPRMQQQRNDQLSGIFTYPDICKNCIETFEPAKDFWNSSPPLYSERKPKQSGLESKMISVLDTSVCDNNLGNWIIMDSVDKYLHQIFPSEFFIRLPYLENIGTEAVKYIKSSEFTFFGGTNSLSSEMEKYKQIGIDHTNYEQIKRIVLFGVGWWQYQGAISSHTQQILKHCLHPSVYHSVRDSYSKNKLAAIGINNVLVTGCPTLWQLTEEHCRQIPRNKAENVLLAFTNYSQDKSDSELFNIVQNRYKNIFVWVQGPEDLEYAKSFGGKINILPPRLDALDELLSSDIELDCVGTRCHAGIRAMQFKRRTIIIGIDNRAIEMQRDFNLPVVPRNNLNALSKIIDGEFETKLNIPFDAIKQWVRQFSANDILEIEKPTMPDRQNLSVKPVSRVFGLDRGRAIDRFYIEKFLEQNKKSITGNVLEIGGDDYTKAYGQNVLKSDVLNAVKGQNVTIVGDLTNQDCLPENYFNCIILTQTLNFIYDVKNTIKNAIRALKPGGTLLITTAGISQISRYDMDRWGDYWRFTSKSLQKMFAEFLPAESFEVKAHGNVAIAKAFLDGLAIEDIDKQLFEYDDNDYQVVLTVRATKPVANVNQINIFGEQSRLCDTNYYKPQHQKDNNCTELAIPDNATLQDLKGIKNVALKTRFGNWKIKFGDLTIYCYDLLSFYNAFKDIFYHQIYDFESNADCPTVIDGGGHIGLFTLYVKCKYPGAKITVFEPDGRSLELLRKNLTANGITDVKIVEAGLYKENTTLSFGSDNSDGSSIFAENRNLSINVVRLSDYIQSPVDFVKLNIEGAELDVISEISSLLCNINELVFEYHGFSEIGQNLHKILPILADAGFRYMIHDFDSETNPATKPPFKLREDTRYFLLVCAKKLFSPVKHNLPIAKMSAVPQQPVILLYHRIADEPMDYQLLCTSPENFESHLKTLSQNYRVIRLAELLDEIKNNRFVPNTIALTFDDGYADNFTNALPLLEKYKIPATIFVTSGMVGSDRLFWWDAMDEIFLKNIQLPDRLRMEDNCGVIEWDLSTIEKRIETHDEICGIFRDKPAEKIYAIVNQLWFWAGLKEKQPLSRRAVNKQELLKLSQSEFVDIGSHTVLHSKLSALSPMQQDFELSQSAEQLKEIIHKPVNMISYPFGGADDFNPATKQIARKCGYSAGIANVQSDLCGNIDMFALPRRLVRNWTGEQFGDWLKSENKRTLEAQTVAARKANVLKYISKFSVNSAFSAAKN
ncbi:MAG TPA: hypothetical protein DDW84_07135 [Phycisphaerales bacterium]|nr:hypothetical protein [Phycisphaerales bacterium]HBR20704.1 hypothetical protein [Phycisphaerales bacterium]